MDPSSSCCEAMCESGEIAVCHLVFSWLHISCAWHKVWALHAMLAWPASRHRMCDVIPSIQALSLRPDRSIPQSACYCDLVDVFIHPSKLSLYDLIDRSPSGLVAVIRLIFHPSIHPHSLRPDRVWACLPAVRWRRRPEEDRTNTRELECIGYGNIEIGIGDQLRQLISQVLSFPSLLCISFFLFRFFCLFGDLFCNFLPSFLWFALLFCCFSVSVSQFPGGCFYHSSN